VGKVVLRLQEKKDIKGSFLTNQFLKLSYF